MNESKFSQPWCRTNQDRQQRSSVFDMMYMNLKYHSFSLKREYKNITRDDLLSFLKAPSQVVWVRFFQFQNSSNK